MKLKCKDSKVAAARLPTADGAAVEVAVPEDDLLRKEREIAPSFGNGELSQVEHVKRTPRRWRVREEEPGGGLYVLFMHT
ncbi:hypothetical protein EYF80_026162 [Liparis tanakae]|uniref:Uncharacterized protein n=1 Tax=Liparis tanakae TaxID=230148 RepID=A0A4Z2HCY6_9TELE|nr:hypothetical protein EYF80_026162 [Liparis tanakae]